MNLGKVKLCLQGVKFDRGGGAAGASERVLTCPKL